MSAAAKTVFDGTYTIQGIESYQNIHDHEKWIQKTYRSNTGLTTFYGIDYVDDSHLIYARNTDLKRFITNLSYSKQEFSCFANEAVTQV